MRIYRKLPLLLGMALAAPLSCCDADHTGSGRWAEEFRAASDFDRIEVSGASAVGYFGPVQDVQQDATGASEVALGGPTCAAFTPPVRSGPSDGHCSCPSGNGGGNGDTGGGWDDGSWGEGNSGGGTDTGSGSGSGTDTGSDSGNGSGSGSGSSSGSGGNGYQGGEDGCDS